MKYDTGTKAGVMLLMALLVGACQPPSEPTGLRIEGAHIKAMPPGQTRAAAYFVLHNHDAEDRQILQVESTVAGQTQVHRHLHEDGMMKMRHVPHVHVPAESSLVFQPGGYHLMLLDIAEPPAVGSQFTVTMELDGGEKVSFPVDVHPL